MKNKIKLLKNIQILSNLSKEELEVLADLSEFQDFKEGTVIFEYGSISKAFYVVDSGEVRISSITAEQKEEVIAFFISGEIFGEFDLFENDPRTANAIANKDTRLLVFPKESEHFILIYKKHTNIFVKIFHNLVTLNANRIRGTNELVSEKTHWIEELRKQMLFDKLTGLYNRSYIEDEFANALKRMGKTVSLLVVKPDAFKSINDSFGHEAGDIALKEIAGAIKELLREKDIPVRYRGNEIVIIFPNVSLNKAIEYAEKFLSTLNNLDFGKIIGNKTLKLTFSIGLANYPNHATNSENLVQKAFDKMLEQRNAEGNGILIADKGEEDYIEFLKSIDIFSSLYVSELKTISKYLHPIKVKAGSVVCKEGEEGNELFIIQSGKAAISIKLQDGKQKEIAEFSSGNFFGEMAIFENAPRSATCISREECKILKLHKDDFFNIMKSKPRAAIKIMIEMLNITSDRLKATGKFLSDMVKWGNEASRRVITDELTGVNNRRYLDSALEEKFNAAKQSNKPLTLIMADLDYFREVNDGYSHEIGDKYIVEVANVFKSCIRETDIIARYGGDEFTIILPDTTLEQGKELGEKIRVSVESLDFLKNYSGPDIKLSTSQGLSAYPKNCKDLKTLKELADQALYKAKEAGRNKVICTEQE